MCYLRAVKHLMQELSEVRERSSLTWSNKQVLVNPTHVRSFKHVPDSVSSGPCMIVWLRSIHHWHMLGSRLATVPLQRRCSATCEVDQSEFDHTSLDHTCSISTSSYRFHCIICCPRTWDVGLLGHGFTTMAQCPTTYQRLFGSGPLSLRQICACCYTT